MTATFNENSTVLIESGIILDKTISEPKEQFSIPSFSKAEMLPYFDCCMTPSIIETRGVYVCQNCAVVHEPIMKEGIFSDGNKRHVETTNGHKFQNEGCRTFFSLERLSPEKRLQFRRLAKLNGFYSNSIEANKVIANRFLLKIISQLEIPQAIYQFTLRIYKRVLSERLTQGRSIKNLTAASLYLACLLNDFSCHISELAKVTQIPEKILRKNYHLIATKFKIKLKRFPASSFLTQFLTNLELSPKFYASAKKFLDLVKQTKIPQNQNPRAIACAIIYLTAKKLANGESVRQTDLATLAKVSEVTIRKYVKIVKNNVDFSKFSA